MWLQFFTFQSKRKKSSTYCLFIKVNDISITFLRKNMGRFKKEIIQRTYENSVYVGGFFQEKPQHFSFIKSLKNQRRYHGFQPVLDGAQELLGKCWFIKKEP